MSEIHLILENFTERAIVSNKNLTIQDKINRLLEINFEPIYIPSILGLLEKERKQFIQLYQSRKDADERKIKTIFDLHKDNICIQGKEIRKIPASQNLYRDGLRKLTEIQLSNPIKVDEELLQGAIDDFLKAMTGLTNYREAVLGMAFCQTLCHLPANHLIEWYAKAYELDPTYTAVRIIIAGFDKIVRKIHSTLQ